MNSKDVAITQELRDAIRRRVRREPDVARAIYGAMAERCEDYRDYTLEQHKQLALLAVRTVRTGVYSCCCA